jgi:hypothetical protein
MGTLMNSVDCNGNTATHIPVDNTSRIVQCDADPAIRVCTDDGSGIVSPNTPDGNTYTGQAQASGYPDVVKSITVTAFQDSVIVTTNSGTIVIPEGSSFSWGDGDNNSLDLATIKFAGNTDTANFSLHWEA